MLKSKHNNNNISHMKYSITFELGNIIGINTFINKHHHFLKKPSNIYNKLKTK
jgi:hypothetical protein